MRIFLDMDEVLTDFVGGACKAWGAEPAAVLAEWEEGKWDIVPPLSRALGREPLLTQDEFWRPINDNVLFWAGLKVLPWAQEVVALVRSLTDDWHVVSSPSYCDTSYMGKVQWLKRFFGPRFNRFCITPHKYCFAQPGTVLIDDRDSNVKSFIRAGGAGIVFPRYHNSCHGLKNDPLAFVSDQLQNLSNPRARSEVCT